MITRSKKTQSETIGFIVIILMVMIIGVIFLGFSLKKQPTVEATDSEIANFLVTSARYTSDCAKDYEPNYREMSDVISDCYQNSACLDGRTTCFVLNKTYTEMLTNFRPSGKVLNYYKLSFYYVQNITQTVADGTKFANEVAFGNSSGCASKRAGRNYISLSSGNGYALEQLEVCLAS